ncbi:EF-hand calcium-binding domain-containing protein 12-like isoform X2 [Anneissia japonica]|uniref:EF-hand calcium-binding domain-containing protein 12-like isoform X2 n=1 Tax=Anneissia japonica TaxID=1529436 RepID=UPI0014254B8E|nr:EF-hand calcium-binding domain-containing protein 12-like isoform X2 [Anneissia japonica]
MELSDFGLKRLFNPDNSEYLPIEEQIQYYKQRDLSQTKNYGTLLRIWGQPKSRRRVIIAPPMNGASGREMMGRHPVKYLTPIENGPIKLEPEDRALSEKEKAEKHQHELEGRSDTFHKWLEGRKKLRSSLDQMGLDENWLMGKDKTALEQRVYKQMKDARIALINSKKKKIIETSSSSDEVIPKIKQPPREAMEILSRHLAAKRERIIDLFSRADKDKSWTISRDEFRKCIKEGNIEMAPQLLEDLVESLDQDNNGEIDYKEFASGMKEHNIGKRKSRKARNRTTTRKAVPVSPAIRSPAVAVIPPNDRVPSAGSLSSSMSPSSRRGSVLLEVPLTDITEQVKLAPDDLLEKRKRERHIRKAKKKLSRSGKVKTYIPAIDQHCLKSTFEGETGENIDRFREEQLKEYYKVLKLCDKHEVNLTPKLLQQALLYPGDKPHRTIKLKSAPGNPFSSNLADPPEPVKPPVKPVDPDKVRVSSTGEMLMEARHTYPFQDDVKREMQMMNLSSGKAFVSRKIDCWMTFEEYTYLTRHLSKRYISMNQTEDPSIFWPGHMLDKLCIYLPRHKETQCLFSSTHQSKRSNPGYHNDLQSWPIGNNGYVKFGDIELLKSYSLEGR